MKRLWTVMIAVVAVSCSEQVTWPRLQTRVASEIQFLEFTPDAFQNTQQVASFWAVRGQDRVLMLRYADTGRKYLRLQIDSASLAAWPDGRPFIPGDSVEITVRADASGRWEFHLSPSGLTFSAEAPAKLTLEYERSNHGDQEPSLWKRDLPFAPWELLPATRLHDWILRVNIYDFTDFGLAIN